MTGMTDGRDTVKAVVVDLDGTFVSGNSFTCFVRWLAGHFVRHAPAKAMRLAVTVLARKLRLISHAGSKRRIVRLAEEGSGKDMLAREIETGFMPRLERMVRPEVAAVVADCRSKGWETVLATAAPSVYAEAFGHREGFGHVISTEDAFPGSGTYVEARGEEKLQRVEALCRKLGIEVGMVITDHHDDIPLLTLPDAERILVSPTPSTLAELKRAGIGPFRVI